MTGKILTLAIVAVFTGGILGGVMGFLGAPTWAIVGVCFIVGMLIAQATS